MKSVNINILHGDCVERMKSLEENSVGSVICDPPYGLEFMGKDWDKLSRNLMNPTSEADIKRKEEYGNSLKGRLSNLPDLSKLSEHSNDVIEWHKDWLREAHRILKPGGIIKAFSATRTYHHLAMAMEQVGFTDLSIEAWTYGSGFPKSLNISKSIDKKLGKQDGEAATKEAAQFDGYGTALKPSWEPFVVGVKQ